MLVASNGNEAVYIARACVGKLRINMGEKTVLHALAQAFVLVNENNPSKSRMLEAEQILENVFNLQPNWKTIIEKLLLYGIDEIEEHIKLTVGIPLRPMLAQPCKSVEECLSRLGNKAITAEYKYDGERSQVNLLLNLTVDSL